MAQIKKTEKNLFFCEFSHLSVVFIAHFHRCCEAYLVDYLLFFSLLSRVLWMDFVRYFIDLGSLISIISDLGDASGTKLPMLLKNTAFDC